jgi:hypothetical protein
MVMAASGLILTFRGGVHVRVIAATDVVHTGVLEKVPAGECLSGDGSTQQQGQNVGCRVALAHAAE